MKVGVKDVAYFSSSCLPAHACAEQAPVYLDAYFKALRAARQVRGKLAASQIQAIEREWRTLFSWAGADFHRFLLGWAPAYAEDDAYGAQQLELVSKSLRAS